MSARDQHVPKPVPQGAEKSPPAETLAKALAEAAARRADVDRKVAEQPKELNGRDGPEPARYGDWERKGIASDF